MQKNPDQKASSKQDEADDLRTSLGEVVRRVDLDRAAGTPNRFVRNDPSIAGYEGIELARAALAGDQAALDEFHELAGLTLPGVTEHNEGDAVRLVMSEIDEKIEGLEIQNEPICQHDDEARAVFQATNEGGNNSTCIDAAELIAWVLSPEGRAALSRRGIIVPVLVTEVPTLVQETDPRELSALIEQLRHACSIALGDLLALGMPRGASTDKVLQAAIVAAEETIAVTEGGAPPQPSVLKTKVGIVDPHESICTWPFDGHAPGKAALPCNRTDCPHCRPRTA
jgi:hypothetical protein